MMDNFFGVKPDRLIKKEIILLIDDAVNSSGRKLTIVTLNPEILLKAEKDADYKNILNNFDLKLVDGFGIKLAGFLKGIKTGERIAGSDLAEYILHQAKTLNLKIGFVMKREGLSNKEELRDRVHDLGIRKFEVIYEKEDLNLIKDSGVLLAGLGAPDQEKFIWENKNNFPNLKLAIGVGGTFDYWTGKKKRAPILMRKMGLEWLWRVIIQPSRFFRIWNATVVFMWKVIKS